jgi:hypothetical protein
MGNPFCADLIKKLVLQNIDNIKPNSLVCENVNNEAFNIYFDNGKRLYCLQVELGSGVHVHLKYHQGYERNGEKTFSTDPIMNHDTITTLKKIRRKTIFSYNERIKKLVIHLCDQINRQQTTL